MSICSCCGATAELSQHLKGFRKKQQFWLEEWRTRVTEYGGLARHEESCNLCAAIIAQQYCMGRRDGKDRVFVT